MRCIFGNSSDGPCARRSMIAGRSGLFPFPFLHTGNGWAACTVHTVLGLAGEGPVRGVPEGSDGLVLALVVHDGELHYRPLPREHEREALMELGAAVAI